MIVARSVCAARAPMSVAAMAIMQMMTIMIMAQMMRTTMSVESNQIVWRMMLTMPWHANVTAAAAAGETRG